MNKNMLKACIVACDEVYYNVPLSDDTIVTLKGNKKDLGAKVKALPDTFIAKAHMDGNGNLHINNLG